MMSDDCVALGGIMQEESLNLARCLVYGNN